MAKLSDFIPQEDIDEYLSEAPEVLQGKIELAAEVVDYAQSIAPVDSGDYRDGIKVRRRGKTGVGVEFTDPISNLIEFGSEHNAEYAVRVKTAQFFGGTAP